jgi:hypothetical protein
MPFSKIMITPVTEARDFDKYAVETSHITDAFCTVVAKSRKWRYRPSFLPKRKTVTLARSVCLLFLFFVSGIPEGGFLRQASGTVASSLLAAAVCSVSAAATGSMLDPPRDGERLLSRHMIAVEDGDANLQLNLQLNRLVAAIRAETEESLSTLELRIAELTAAIKRRSDVELALTHARLMTAEAELSEFCPSRASGQRAAKQAQAKDAQGGTFECEAGKPEEPRRRQRAVVREGGRPLQRWL